MAALPSNSGLFYDPYKLTYQVYGMTTNTATSASSVGSVKAIQWEQYDYDLDKYKYPVLQASQVQDAPLGNVAWLNKRVQEMRVRL